jgi:hypothetical protein
MFCQISYFLNISLYHNCFKTIIIFKMNVSRCANDIRVFVLDLSRFFILIITWLSYIIIIAPAPSAVSLVFQECSSISECIAVCKAFDLSVYPALTMLSSNFVNKSDGKDMLIRVSGIFFLWKGLVC